MSVESIFAAASLKSAGDRSTYLAEACGDDAELRRKVERLLKAHDAAGGFLEEPPASDRTGPFITIAETVGTKIGPYKLKEQIGEGGFGLVFVAEQTEPVKRKVALKVIKPGMDSRQVIARFEAERQALALMDHPNIARVLDAGATESGRPYFVMELVRGVPITEYCDKNLLPPKERLELFVTVCQAIQHAHQKGIIHRDVKPSNVLVTSHDGKPVAKVIDFGVAKAIHQQLSDRSIYTNFAQMIGTPLYMSPEQAEMSGLDIDTRSDIYSLGVLMYELLTGTTPLDRKQFAKAAYDEIRRLIREEEPQKPSTRLSSSDSIASIAAQRHTEPAKLSKLMRGDLDWITMKCLEKDRTRRYETANGLAREIQRYLSDEPVEACPPSATYRLRKFAKKNRAVLTTAGAIAFLLLAGISVSSWLAVRASRAEGRAQDAVLAEREAKYKMEQVAEAENKSRQIAEMREAETRAVLKFVEDKVFAAARPAGLEGGLGFDVSLRKTIEAAIPYVVDSFPNQPLIEARLRLTLGTSFNHLELAALAADQNEAARMLFSRHRGPEHPDTMRSTVNLAWSYHLLGRYSEALKLCEETLKVQKSVLGDDHPDTLETMVHLADCLNFLGRYAEGFVLTESVLKLRLAKLGENHFDSIMALLGLGNSNYLLARHAQAQQCYEAAIALLKAHHPNKKRELVGITNMLANALSASKQHAKALELREWTTATEKTMLGPDHPGTLGSMNNLASSYFAVGRFEESLKLYEETVMLKDAKLGRNHPSTLQTRFSMTRPLFSLHRGQEAIRIIDDCLQRGSNNPDVKPGFLRTMFHRRLWYYSTTVNSGGCRATAEKWEDLNRTDTESYYASAAYRAVTAAVQAKSQDQDAARLAREDADKSMAWLQKAVAAGWKDAALMKKDADLDALRDREDFKKLIADLEKK